MSEKRVEEASRWREPLYLSIVGSVILFAVACCQFDVFLLLSVFVIAPVLVILTVAWPIYLAVRHRRQLLSCMAAMVVLWTVAAFLFQYDRRHPFALHETAKWLVWSREYKQEVLGLPSANADLKHMEWDRSGFAGVANNTAYLVFDPSDSLSNAKNDRVLRVNGKSCSVRNVRRLERHWYSVLFYTDETWNECN